MHYGSERFTYVTYFFIGAFPNNILNQSFRVRFVHATSASGTPAFLSGNPGYEIGHPVISGNLGTSAIVRSDSLRIWQPG